MGEIVTALGLVLVIEGLIWAISPSFARRMLEALAVTPEQPLRLAGVIAIAVGVALVWSVRGT